MKAKLGGYHESKLTSGEQYRSMGGAGYTFRVYGLREDMRVLRKIEPELQRHLDLVLRQSAQGVALTAVSNIVHEVSGDTREMMQVRKFRGAWSVIDTSVGAQFIENAGRIHPTGLTPQGSSLIGTLDHIYGTTPGRFVWPAFVERRDEIERDVTDVVHQVEVEITRQLQQGARI